VEAARTARNLLPLDATTTRVEVGDPPACP
jgi:hypothetical protein